VFSEASAYKIQTQGNYPEESIKHSEHGKSLKSSIGRVSTNFFVLRLNTNLRCYVSDITSHVFDINLVLYQMP
jgi:hypothetical protein